MSLISRDIDLSPCERFRYFLHVDWTRENMGEFRYGPHAIVIGHHPTESRNETGDYIATRIITILRRHGFGSLTLFNLFPLRHTAFVLDGYPKAVARRTQQILDSIGKEVLDDNLRRIQVAVTNDPDHVICCWGGDALVRRSRLDLKLLPLLPPRVFCFGVNERGFPCSIISRPQVRRDAAIIEYHLPEDTDAMAVEKPWKRYNKKSTKQLDAIQARIHVIHDLLKQGLSVTDIEKQLGRTVKHTIKKYGIKVSSKIIVPCIKCGRSLVKRRASNIVSMCRTCYKDDVRERNRLSHAKHRHSLCECGRPKIKGNKRCKICASKGVNYKKAVAMRRKGISFSKIAKKYGCNSSVFYRYCSRHGLTFPPLPSSRHRDDLKQADS